MFGTFLRAFRNYTGISHLVAPNGATISSCGGRGENRHNKEAVICKMPNRIKPAKAAEITVKMNQGGNYMPTEKTTIKHQLIFDYTDPSSMNHMSVMQGDTESRSVRAILMSNHTDFQVPEGWHASIAYQKPDGKQGWYDRMPDGSDACTIMDNEVILKLAPEMLTCPGAVFASIVLQGGGMDQISTWPFVIHVMESPTFQQQKSNEYFDLRRTYMDQHFAGALKVTETASIVSTNMVSEIEHDVDIKITGIVDPDYCAVSVEYYIDNVLHTDYYYSDVEGNIKGVRSHFPYMRVGAEDPDAVITLTYNADIKKYLESKCCKTPVKGVDYWTAQDRQEIVRDVLTALQGVG